MSETPPLLRVENLRKSFSARRGLFGRKTGTIAVDDVSFELKKGETLGLVGESGCGKSTLALTVMRLYQPDGGRIVFDGAEIGAAREKSLKSMRAAMQMIFQDPLAALDPRLTIAQIIAEPLEIHRRGTRRERYEKAAQMLRRVGLGDDALERFPTEFSGGQQQRIGIARALVMRPKLLICDEAVSALDVSVQAQILNLLRDLQDEFGISYLFISHNIAVTAFMSDRIGVMYLGKLVEIGESRQVAENPRHPYTRNLIAAIPEPVPPPVGADGNEPIIANDADEEMPAETQNETNLRPSGCVYRRRCPLAQEICAAEEPVLREIEKNRQVACHFA